VDEALKRRVIDEILNTMCSDGVKSWRLREAGTYERILDAPPLRSQVRFIELARERARENEAILGLSKAVVTPPVRALDKLRRRDGKKRKRRKHED
jgi:hypothetical protein